MVRCVCASMKPGRSVASPRSITRAPGGMLVLPTDTMRSPRTTITPPLLSSVPVEANRCAALRTIVSDAAESDESAAIPAAGSAAPQAAPVNRAHTSFSVLIGSPSGSDGVLDREAGERREPLLIRGVGQGGERGERRLALGAGAPRGIFESAGGVDGGDHRLEVGAAAAPDRITDCCALSGGAGAKRVNQRQCRLAFGEIVSQVLAALARVGAVVEHV